MLIVDKHCCDVCCDEFPVAQVDRQSKQIKNSDMENFICNQYGENTIAVLNAENTGIEICGWIKKGSGDINAICLHFLPYAMNICRKFFLIFPR